jgi:hypothetical protein
MIKRALLAALLMTAPTAALAYCPSVPDTTETGIANQVDRTLCLQYQAGSDAIVKYRQQQLEADQRTRLNELQLQLQLQREAAAAQLAQQTNALPQAYF